MKYILSILAVLILSSCGGGGGSSVSGQPAATPVQPQFLSNEVVARSVNEHLVTECASENCEGVAISLYDGLGFEGQEDIPANHENGHFRITVANTIVANTVAYKIFDWLPNCDAHRTSEATAVSGVFLPADVVGDDNDDGSIRQVSQGADIGFGVGGVTFTPNTQVLGRFQCRNSLYITPAILSRSSEQFINFLSDSVLDGKGFQYHHDSFSMATEINQTAESLNSKITFQLPFKDNHKIFYGFQQRGKSSAYLLGADIYTDFHSSGKVRLTSHESLEHDIRMYSAGFITNMNQSEYRIGVEHGEDGLTSGGFRWQYTF